MRLKTVQDQLLREKSSLEQRELQRQLEIATIAKERKVRVQSGGAFAGHGNSTESGPHVAESGVSPPHPSDGDFWQAREAREAEKLREIQMLEAEISGKQQDLTAEKVVLAELERERGMRLKAEASAKRELERLEGEKEEARRIADAKIKKMEAAMAESEASAGRAKARASEFEETRGEEGQEAVARVAALQKEVERERMERALLAKEQQRELDELKASQLAAERRAIEAHAQLESLRKDKMEREEAERDALERVRKLTGEIGLKDDKARSMQSELERLKEEQNGKAEEEEAKKAELERLKIQLRELEEKQGGNKGEYETLKSELGEARKREQAQMNIIQRLKKEQVGALGQKY